MRMGLREGSATEATDRMETHLEDTAKAVRKTFNAVLRDARASKSNGK